MRVPMPSPRKTNFAKMFMTVPHPAGAYDAAPPADCSELLEKLGLWAVANLTDEQAAQLNDLVARFQPGGPAGITAGDEDDDEKLKKVRALLRAAGLNDADIDEAIRLATNSGGKATDRKAKDGGVLLLNGMNGGLGGAPAEPKMDPAALEAELDRKFGSGRIEGEPVRQAADRRTVADDSDAALARFAAMFPEAARIGHA
jgi:hypothetical protein